MYVKERGFAFPERIAEAVETETSPRFSITREGREGFLFPELVTEKTDGDGRKTLMRASLKGWFLRRRVEETNGS